MAECLAAFVGSLIGVAVGITATVHLGRRYEERQAAKRKSAKLAHPAGKARVVESEVESSAYARKWSA